MASATTAGQRDTSPRRVTPFVAIPVAAILLLLLAAVGAPAASPKDPSSAVVVHLCLIIAVVGGVATICSPLPARWKLWSIAALAGVLLAAGATIALSGSPFPIFGTFADQGHRVAQIERFEHSIGLRDFAYKGLPTFYPPLFFWVLGRAGAITSTPAYEMLKVGMIAVAGAIPLVTAGLWSLITRRWSVVATIMLATLIIPDWYEPYAWLAVAIFVPWWLSFVLQIGRRRELTRVELLVGAALGAVVVTLYYYWFFVGVVQLVALLAVRRWARERGRPLPPARPRQSLIVLGGAAVLSAVYWLPMLVSIVTTPGAQSIQNRYYTFGQVPIPVRFTTFDLVGIVMLFGLGYLLLTARRSVLSFALLTLVAASYAWFVIGYVGVLVDVPLATNKLGDLTNYLLVAGAAVGTVDVARAARASEWVRARIGQLGLAGGAAIAIAVLVFGQSTIDGIPWIKEQQEAKAPTKLLADLRDGTGGRYENSVLLTDQALLAQYRPVYLFNVWDAHYSHPAGLFDDRLRFLKRLARVDDPDVVAYALEHNRYDHVDWLALRPDPKNGVYLYDYIGDGFLTEAAGVKSGTIKFPAASFDGFVGVHGHAVDVFRPPPHPEPLTRAQRRELARRFPGDLER